MSRVPNKEGFCGHQVLVEKGGSLYPQGTILCDIDRTLGIRWKCVPPRQGETCDPMERLRRRQSRRQSEEPVSTATESIVPYLVRQSV